MANDFYLFIRTTKKLPDEKEKNKHEIIYCSDGIEKHKYDDETFEYYLVVIAKTTTNIEPIISVAKTNWYAIAGSNIELELITDNLEYVADH